jgi:hypothetical protein
MDIIIRPGEPEDGLSMPLYTQKRNFIPNEQRLESAPEILRAAVSIMRKNRPDARLRSITATYNCLGMAFASRRTHIDPMHLSKILRDDGYRLLQPDEAASPGDVVVYKNKFKEPVHVGLVIKTTPNVDPGQPPYNIEVLSKWGYDGEYLHEVTYVPEVLGSPEEYWTDRKIL